VRVFKDCTFLIPSMMRINTSSYTLSFQRSNIKTLTFGGYILLSDSYHWGLVLNLIVVLKLAQQVLSVAHSIMQPFKVINWSEVMIFK